MWVNSSSVGALSRWPRSSNASMTHQPATSAIGTCCRCQNRTSAPKTPEVDRLAAGHGSVAEELLSSLMGRRQRPTPRKNASSVRIENSLPIL